MDRIHKLSARVANQIAAGEVITEPLSVIKELVENSLDAAARSIEIEIEEAGLKRIFIKDDGQGILYEDAGLVFERHATSKINTATDLKSLVSYGFRGEALASIAAVSKVSLSSRHRDQIQGFETIIYGGNNLSLKRISRQIGTSFLIEDLFYNTPVREGFLKKPGILETNIISFVKAMALGNPEVSFRLHSDNRLVLQTYGRGRDKAMTEVLGQELESLIPVEFTGRDYKFEGYLSSLSFSKTNSKSQYYLVNNRLVENQELKDLVKKTYQGLLPQRRFPAVYFFIEVDPKDLDVNIHPRKMEVRFSDISLLRDLEDNLRSYLYGRQIHPVIEDRPVQPKLERLINRPIYEVEDIPLNIFESVTIEKKEEIAVSENLLTSYDDFFLGLSYLGQAFASFLIFQKGSSIYFCDQHAAHEKILYERFMKDYREDKLDQQILLLPLTIKLDASQLLEVERKAGLISSLGFDYEVFSRDSVVLRSIPLSFSPNQAELFFQDILEGETSGLDEEALIARACKAAIKAQDSLEEIEVDELLNQLRVLNNPHSCPHGRPIFIEMPRKELERRFER